MDSFLGKDNFTWFVGVVEDRQDPLKLGRVRVRCFGWHLDDKGLPTDKLPWAHPIQPISSAAMSGIGQSPVGPVEGTHVVGFYADGPNGQQPIIMGTLGGIPRETNYRRGGAFRDPFGNEKGERPNGPYPLDSYLGEPSQDESGKEIYPESEADTNRLARGVTMNPDLEPLVGIIHEAKIAGASGHLGHKIANQHGTDGISWNEIYPPYNAVYPYNHVYESESGHTIEIDDTPGAERIHTRHRSGSFQEFHPDGSRVDKTIKDYNNFVLGTAGVHISGHTDIMIGTMKDDEKGYPPDDEGGWPHGPVSDIGDGRSRMSLLVRGASELQLDQGFTANVYATAGTNIYGPALTNVFNNTVTNISQNQTLAVAETSSFSAKNTNVTSTENLTIHTEEDTKLRSNDDLSIETKDDFTIVTTGDLTIKTKGNVKIETKGDFRHDVEGNYVLNVKGDEGIKMKVQPAPDLHQIEALDSSPFPLEIELE